jgi:ubiquinone/menaquinone biosynthesis C-methylase UbiE
MTATVDEVQQRLDEANARFWDELCGTRLAQDIGITDRSSASLHKFDDAYFRMYPYLLPTVRPDEMAGKAVLEIGLGYGSLSQKLAEAGAHYTGMDIAEGPVRMVNDRLRMAGLPGKAVRGNALAMPFPDASLDYLVSIGCFHHTGNVQKCLDETYRVLRPGGACVVMLYNKFSFRQWRRRPLATLRERFRDRFGGDRRLDAAALRGEYDAHVDGTAAPEVTLHSVRELRRRFGRFCQVQVEKQNCDRLFLSHDIAISFREMRGRLAALYWANMDKRNRKPMVSLRDICIPRKRLLGTLGRWLGLDLYVRAVK